MKQEFGTPFSVTATHATSAVATKTGTAGLVSYITDMTGSSDKSGSKILIKDGTTVIWQDIVNAGNYAMNFNTPIRNTAGADISVTVDGTALCNANFSGFTL